MRLIVFLKTKYLFTLRPFICLLVAQATLMVLRFLKFPLAFPTNFSRNQYFFSQLFNLFFKINHIFFVGVSWFLSCLTIFGFLNSCLLLSGKIGSIDLAKLAQIARKNLRFVFSNNTFFLEFLFTACGVSVRWLNLFYVDLLFHYL